MDWSKDWCFSTGKKITPFYEKKSKGKSKNWPFCVDNFIPTMKAKKFETMLKQSDSKDALEKEKGKKNENLFSQP